MEINTINLVGRAGREPDVRYFESGSIVANFTLAVNRRTRDEEPDWFNLEIWGKQAQIAADYVKKGSLVGITGSLKIDSWKDKNTGEDRYKPVVRVDRLNFDLPQVNLISFSPSSIIIKTSDPDGKRLIISKKVTAETDTSPDCKTSALILSEQ